jgi:two-component sensor histidine kinase/putative methionine-R-sulfoxide reductase with GAF domain
MADDKPQVSDNEVLRQHQRVLIDLARYSTETIDFQNFLNDVVIRVSAALEIDHVKIMRYRPDAGDLIVEAGVGWNPGSLRTVSFATDMASPPGRAFQTGQPVMLTDLANAPGFRKSRVLVEHGIVSLLNVPVLNDSACWGVLEVDSTVLRGFSEDTIVFLTGVAALISLSIRRAEEQEHQTKAATDAAREIQRREVLLREMQHRVKNNFQTILAMLSMHRTRLSADGANLLEKLGDAIQAMSLAHDQLSPSQTGFAVALSNYLRAQAANMQRTVENAVIEVMADELSVSIEQAVPIGLIVNELVTNSVKYAFGKEGGIIRVELMAAVSPGMAKLVVRDNGRGMGAQKSQGTGLTLVRALATQIRGQFEQESSSSGTVTSLSFPTRPV